MTLFSLAASRNYVNRTHLPESEKVKKMNAIYGPKCLEQLEKFDRVGLLAKTFSDLLIGQTGWYSTKCKLTWKLRGTKYSRMYCQLAPSTLPTDGIEFGLLPTPDCSDRRSDNSGQWGLSNYAKNRLLPTPNCQETPHHEAVLTETGRRKAANGNSHSMNIADLALRGMLPTPTAMDSNGATANMKSSQVKEGSMHSVTLSRWAGMLGTPTAQACRADVTQNRGRGSMADTIAMNLLLPTPTADDNPAKNTGKRNQDGLQKRAYQTTGKTSQLSHQFVCEMMGFPINYLDLW